MNVDAPCPNCDTVFTVRRELLGKRTKCTRCGTVFTIAESAATQTPPAVQPTQVTPATSPKIATPPPAEIPIIPQITVDPQSRATSRAAQSQEFFGFERASSQPRFPTLRKIARGFEILAVIVLAIAPILLLLFVIAVIKNPDALLSGILGAGLAVFWSTLVAISLLAAAQAIRLALQIEENTRETHQACRQLADHLCSIETEP